MAVIWIRPDCIPQTEKTPEPETQELVNEKNENEETEDVLWHSEQTQ